jgi:hypothetical protein
MEIFINDFINRPVYYIGGRTAMSSFLKTIPSRIVQAEYLAFIAVAKVDSVAHEAVEKNKELYDYVNSILKYSERDEALNSDRYLDDMYKMTKNQLKKSYDFKVHIDFDNYTYWAGGENVLEATQNIISYHDQNNVWKVELIGDEEDNNLVIKSNSATKEDLENLIESLSMDPTDTYEKAIKEIEKEVSNDLKDKDNDLNKKFENDLLMEDILGYDVIGSKEIYPVENINKESMNEILGEFLRGYELSLDHKEEAFVA